MITAISLWWGLTVLLKVLAGSALLWAYSGQMGLREETVQGVRAMGEVAVPGGGGR